MLALLAGLGTALLWGVGDAEKVSEPEPPSEAGAASENQTRGTVRPPDPGEADSLRGDGEVAGDPAGSTGASPEPVRSGDGGSSAPPGADGDGRGGAGGGEAPEPTSPSREPAPVCIESLDPRCGPFRWVPDPAPNAPLRVFLELDTVIGDPDRNTVLAGHETQFFVYATDDDARIDVGCIEVDFGDGAGAGTCDDRSIPPARFGPWPPPAPAPDRQVRTFRHTYHGLGPHTLTARVRSSSGPPGYDPFGAEVEVTLQVHVI